MKYIKMFIALLVFITFCVLCFYLNDLYLLKNIYVIIGLVVFFLLISLMILGLFKLKSKIVKIILVLLLVIITAINSIGTYYLSVTNKFINKFDEEVVEYDYYYLLSLKENGYSSVNDLKGKTIGLTDRNIETVKDFVSLEHEDKVSVNISELISNFYVDNLGAVFVDEIEKYVWQEYDEEFFNDIVVVETFKKEKKNDLVSSEEDKTTVDIKSEDPFVMYISGIDNNGSINNVGRSDVNIVMTVNPKTSQILLTSIPRDYYVQLYGTTGVKDKLTHAGVYGIDMSIATIESLLGIDINYYARVNFNTVTDLINLLGGVEVYSDINIKHCNVVPGVNYLNGKNALCFARERKSYVGGDRQRGINQEIVIEALIKKVSTSKDLLLKYNEVLNSISNNLNTNVSSNFIKQMVGLQLDKMPSWEVKFLNLDGTGASKVTYSCGDMLLYVMEPNYDTVNNAKAAIYDVFFGKKFSEMNYPFTK